MHTDITPFFKDFSTRMNETQMGKSYKKTLEHSFIPYKQLYPNTVLPLTKQIRDVYQLWCHVKDSVAFELEFQRRNNLKICIQSLTCITHESSNLKSRKKNNSITHFIGIAHAPSDNYHEIIGS